MESTKELLKYNADIGDMTLSLFIPTAAEYKSISLDSTPLLHSHSYVEIFVCLEGEITLRGDGVEKRLSPNDIAIMPSEHQHAAIMIGRCSYFTVSVVGTKQPSKMVRSVYNEYADLLESNSARIYRKAEKIANQLLELYLNKEDERSAIPVIKMASILSDLVRDNNYDTLNVGIRERGGPAKSDISTFLAIEKIINCYFTEAIRYDEITAMLHISRRHLDRLISEKYGKTLREMVYNSRINLAKNLLIQTDMSLDTIAFNIGFSSTPSFRNCFVSIVGMTPTEYRRLNAPSKQKA